MIAVFVFSILSFFLVIGKILRVKLTFLQRLYLPSSVIGGAVAPRLFAKAWFERAIADFGQSLGVTATGVLLLRTVDPENKTDAAAAFGYKQLLHEPFMGGGLCTALALTLVFTVGWFKVFVVSLALFIFWSALIVLLICKNRKRK